MTRASSIVAAFVLALGFLSTSAMAQSNPLDRKRNPLQRGAAPAPAGNVQKFSLVTIRDPGVNNIAAMQVMVPQGWQAEGRIVWLPSYSVACNLELVVRDPQTGMSVQWLPSQSFTWMQNPPGQVNNGDNYMGRIWMQPIGDPAQFVQWFYAQQLPHLRNARFAGGEDFQKQAQFYTSQMHGNGQKQVRSVRMRYEFDAPNGQPWEEDVLLTLAFNGNNGAVMWEAFAASSVRGPKGSLDAMRGVTQTVLNSTQFTPEWLASRTIVQQLFTKGLKDMQRDQAVVGQQLAAYREHIAQLSQQIHDDRMKSADARSEAFRETLGGVENYADPFQNQPVYLPAGHKEYWANAKGEYILSDEWNYNPNAGDTTEWKKIDRIDPMNRGR
ncbi:hypothetical protein BH09PLA1_BH09PLA1_16350 [soil metagenome]